MITLMASVIIDPKTNRYIIGRTTESGIENIIELPEDIQQRIRYTMNKKVIMGRHTFDYVGILPGRSQIVLTHKTMDYIKDNKDISFCNQINWESLSKIDEEFVIYGGASVYEQAIKYATKLRLTFINVFPTYQFIGDVYFPKYDGNWIIKNVGSEYHPTQHKSLLDKGVTLNLFQVIEFVKKS